VSYRAAAEQVAGWLVSTAEQGPQGWCWPLQPGVAPDVEHGLGWGTAGPVLFFVEAFLTTGDERWPETTYMQGAAGIGSTLLRLHRHLAGDPWTVRWPHAPDWTAAPAKTVLTGRGSNWVKGKKEGTR
jgi:hypothetical protein